MGDRSESIGYGMGKRFFRSLRAWVERLSGVKLTVDEGRKLELIIGLINSLIFIQTLSNYGAIEPDWIKKHWSHYERMWLGEGKLKVLEKFLGEIDELLHLYQDMELFKENILDYVLKNGENIDRFYRNLKLVLGLTHPDEPPGASKGITQYNFRYIDEDVLGKAYETFLAGVRKERGVYYTPKHITQYIAEKAVGRVFDQLLDEIERALVSEDFERAKELIRRFTSIRVLDPACGSGSFLVKSIRVIADRYRKLYQIFESIKNDLAKEHPKYRGSLDSPREIKERHELISEIEEIVRANSPRELISKIIVRHIYGVDLDRRSLEVAKLNIWLEAIRHAPEEFRYDKPPPDTGHTLPSLDINLRSGDSLVGLGLNETIKFLASNYKEEIKELTKLRNVYLKNPNRSDVIQKLKYKMNILRKQADSQFVRLLENSAPTKRGAEIAKLINITRPLHWALEFWFSYFDEEGEPLPPNEAGFDIIIGNPPYGRMKQLIKEKDVKEIYSKYYDMAYKHQRGNYNYYKLFIERSFYLLKEGGLFAMIFPTAFLGERNSQPLRKLLFENTKILAILQFPEKTRVFDGVTQDVTVLIYVKSKGEEDYSIKIRTNITKEELERLGELDFLELKASEIRELTGEDYRIPIFSRPREEWIILKKISRFPPFRGNDEAPPVGEVGEGHLHETFDKEFLSQKPTRDLVVKGIHLDQYFVNLDPSGPQPRWVRKEAFLRKKPAARESLRYVRIIGRNTLNRSIRPRLRFAILPTDYIITNSIKYIIRKDESLDHAYIVGLLNSALLNWRFELFSSQNNIRNYEIEELPIVRAGGSSPLSIAKRVSRIMELKKARYYWLKFWNKWKDRMKTGEYSLYEILLEDAKLMRRGEFSKAWTSNAAFHPPISGKGGTAFSNFMVRGESERNIIRIYGTGAEGREELAYEMEFGNRELMLHVYCSLLNALESKKKIKTLTQLLTKTAIPVIKKAGGSSSELTPNIVRKTVDEYKRWINAKGIEAVGTDIVKIDNEIENLKAEIDALVFRLYGLSEDEARVVLDSLNTPSLYREKVLGTFREL